MPILKECDSAVLHQNSRLPLMIGCSGGGGHNTAIKGIKGFLENKYGDRITFPEYQSKLFNKDLDSNSRKQIQLGAAIMHTFFVGKPIRGVVRLTPLPVLPQIQDIEAETNKLSNEERKIAKRNYIDMLLDVYPAGYESAAIWNVLQRADETSQLRKLIDFQAMSDRENYQVVKDYYFNELVAHAKSSPYTEVISTQAMALPALCDAVKAYNEWLDQQKLENKPSKVVIHQYMTDLPTKGAVHFFNSLSTLTADQQSQMKLYAVGLKQEIIHHFFPKGNSFAGLYNIPFNENPMVRPGFKDPALDNSQKFNEDISISLKGYDYEKETDRWNKGVDVQYTIKAKEQIASIMLGSQAGADTVEYILPLLNKGMDKVFVFGGQQNKALSDKIDGMLQKYPQYKGKIIRLGNQDDVQIAPLMSRSNMVVIRGGGLSVMEQLAMNHNPLQTVLIHHANSTEKNLSSGISWEDDNVTSVIEDLKSRGVHAKKTSPNRASRHLNEAQLINGVKRLFTGEDISVRAQLIETLSNTKLNECLTEMETNRNVPGDHLIRYFDESERKAKKSAEQLKLSMTNCQEYIKHYINNQLDLELKNKSTFLLVEGTKIVSPLQYDLDLVLEAMVKKEIHLSKELRRMLKTYSVIQDLNNTLKQEGSAVRNLDNFVSKYNQKSYQKTLYSSNDNIFIKLLQEIEYQLSKISFLKPIEKHFTPQQTLRKQMDGLNDTLSGDSISSEEDKESNPLGLRG